MRVQPKHPKNGTEEAGRPARPGFLRSQRGAASGNTDFWRNDPARPHARVTLTSGSLRCFEDAGGPKQAGLETPDWEQLLVDITTHRDCLAKDATLVLSGGEPLMAGGCITLAQHARDRGFQTTLLTNGSLIKDAKTAGWIRQAFSRVQVSFDGASSEVFDAIRGPGAFQQTVRGIDHLLDAECDVSLAITVFPQNRGDLRENLQPFLHRWKGKVGVHFNPEIEKLGRARKLAADYFQAQATDQTITSVMERLQEAGWPVEERKWEVGVRMDNCGLGAGFTVGADGTVFLCAGPRYPMGRYPDLSVTQIIRLVGELYLETRVERLTACSTCDVRYWCGGGCRIRRYDETGSFDKPHCDPRVRASILARLFSEPSGRVMDATHRSACRELQPRGASDSHPATVSDW